MHKFLIKKETYIIKKFLKTNINRCLTNILRNGDYARMLKSDYPLYLEHIFLYI